MSKRKVERIPHRVFEKPSMGSKRVDIYERHESFGLVQVNRITHMASGAKNNMFGSHLDHHPATFRFTVHRAVRMHTDLAMDRYHHDYDAERPELIEFETTATQFVDLLTGLNVGLGVPCSIRAVLGEPTETVPEDHKTERQLIRERFSEDMRDVAKSVEPHTDAIDAILSKKSIGKADREAIAREVEQIVRTFSDHAPFVMKQFSQASDRFELAAKAEIEASAESLIRSAGLEALRNLKATDPEYLHQAIEAEAVDVEVVEDDGEG